MPADLPGHLADNVMHFGRVLRDAGLPLGTDRIGLALAALQVAGLGARRDFHDTLAACFLDRVEHRELFDQAFDLFWQPVALAGLAAASATAAAGAIPPSQRLGEALFPRAADAPAAAAAPRDAPDAPASTTANDAERLRKADFETMSADEWQAARRALHHLAPFFEHLPTRRMQAATHPGRPDPRATLRAMARSGGTLWQLRWRQPRERPAPLVVLADISGSMSRYSRMLLHFAHALGHAEARVESFVFGTRLTRTTRALRQRDPDRAVAQVVRDVADWSGGTRISECLQRFNRHWARRVLSGRATVLLITDGLEHGNTDRLSFEMERLHKSCRRLVWLNPLLRFQRFEPRAGGIRAMLPHVDAFLPSHNLESLDALTRVFSESVR